MKLSLTFLIILSFLFAYYAGAGYSYVQQSLTVIYDQSSFDSSNSLDQIDEQLYSRQLYVYGRHAQQRLLEGHAILYYDATNEQIAAEIVKNLALAGIGRISVYCAGRDERIGIASKPTFPTLSHSKSLAAYAHELNPLVVTQTLSSSDELDEILADPNDATNSVLIAADISFADMVKLNNRIRAKVIDNDIFMKPPIGNSCKFISAKVESLCGFLFNDFSPEFHVADVEGGDANGFDSGKEIPLKSVRSTPDSIGVRIDCIEEENLQHIGLGDSVEVSVDLPGAAAIISKVMHVKQVINTKSIILEADSKQDVDIMCKSMLQGRAMSLRKTKKTTTVNHISLERQLIRPKFAPCNGCLPDKIDRAQSLTLLAAFKASERSEPYESVSTFKGAIVAKLITMGILDPLKPLKEKGGVVGEEMVNQISERFFRSFRCERKCAATVSVVGSLAAQEAIKAITHIYTPVSQILMFESLDSLMPTEYCTKPGMVGKGTVASSPPLQRLVLPYGPEISEELERMKIFVVGSGAIGCELLKNFAMMNIRSDPSKKKSVLRSRGTLRKNGRSLFPARGGIVLTDMDHIEKSNLNRQLLFREKHVGQSKSLVASETIANINPNLEVRALTEKVSADNANGQFNDDFWGEVDLVITALDNVDARKFVDDQCVKYRRHMLDSGTLGTKGNTQVVLPHVTESYSSSADPPEEAIPLCTLKSFPYQPDHCVSWARSIFDQYFLSDVRTLKTFLTEISEWSYSDSQLEKHILSALEELSVEDISRLWNALKFLPTPNHSLVDVAAQSLQWALSLFDNLFQESVAKLVVEHPQNSTDEDGAPFWGGSRRFPTTISGFDSYNPIHTDFVRWAAWLYAKVFGHTIVSENKVLAFCSDEILQKSLAVHRENQKNKLVQSEVFSAESLLRRMLSLKISPQNLNDLLRADIIPVDDWQPEEFEKDDLALGHVAFVTSAANMRCLIYSLRGVDQLEVQKVAGKIVPALATTTSLVAGLVSLELLKVASERVIQRNRHRQQNQQSAQKIMASEEKNRLLSRYRNSFVNMARPLLAFAQPVEAETFGVSKKNKVGFNMWDTIEIEGMTTSTLTVSALSDKLLERFGVELQSISLGDTLLYASFLPAAENKFEMTLQALHNLVQQEDESSGDEDIRDNAKTRPVAVNLDSVSFWDLDLGCVERETSEDIRIPPLRIENRFIASDQEQEIDTSSANTAKLPDKTDEECYEESPKAKKESTIFNKLKETAKSMRSRYLESLKKAFKRGREDSSLQEISDETSIDGKTSKEKEP